jgi:uncharacterized protein (TIGR02646 family)
MFNLSPLPLSSMPRVCSTNGTWESVTANFKDWIRTVAFINQFGTCCYCALEIDSERSRMADIEHFAHKVKYPQWTFDPDNLLLACKHCNQTRKRTYDTVRVTGASYRGSDFWIVHPYLDHVPDHIRGGFYNISHPPSIPLPNSLEGARSIRLFALQSMPKLEEWTRLYYRHVSQKGFTSNQLELFDKAVSELAAYRSPSVF